MKRLLTLTLILVVVFSAMAVAFVPVTVSAGTGGDPWVVNPPPYEPPTGGGTIWVNDGYVYDSGDNALYYNTQDNVVFNAKGAITYDNTSSPLYYNPQTKKFTNSAGNVLNTFERDSSRGGQYLKNGTYTVSSVGIEDIFYQFKRSDNSDILVKVLEVEDETTWWERAFGKVVRKFHYEVSDLMGKHLVKGQLLPEFNFLFENHIEQNDTAGQWTKIWANYHKDKIISKYPKDTLFNWLKKIELVNPDTEVLQVVDDRDNLVNVVDGQLWDYFDYPLIGADAKPVFYDKDTKVFFGSDLRVLAVSDGYLMDGNTRVHSVITNLMNGELLYFLFMRDNVTICPLHGEPQTDKDGYYNGNINYFYLNGQAISESDFIIPEVSEADIYVRYPELKSKDTNDGSSFLSDLLGGFDMSGLLNILLIFVLIIAGIALLPTLLPLVIKFIVWLVTIPFKLIGAIVKAVKRN